MKKPLLLFLIIIFQKHFAQADCFTVVAGRDVSVTGHVMAAHNEDDYGDLIVNLYRVPENFFKETDSSWIKNDPWFDKASLSMLWFQTTRQNFGDVYVNEYGVAIFSNACASREDTATGKLTHQLRRLVIQYAESARNGVKILGHLVEKFGYASSGRTYTIVDNNEAFLVSVVQGRRWIAQRVPDDHVAVIPNYYTIGKVNLKDTVNFLYSPDIVNYAIKRGWYDPVMDGEFSFREVYAKPSVLRAAWNLPRHWAALRFLAPEQFYPDDIEFPFSFAPNSLVTRQQLERILSDHYEDSELSYPSYAPTPHGKQPLSICNAGTKFSVITSFVTKFPNHKDNIVWFSPMKSCIYPMIPISLSVMKIPHAYQAYPLRKALKLQRQDSINTFERNKHHAFAVFNRYRQYVDTNYPAHIEHSRQLKKKFEGIIQKTRKHQCARKGSFLLLKKLRRFYKKAMREIRWENKSS